MSDVKVYSKICAALDGKRAALEIFGEAKPEGIRVRQACFCPETGAQKEDRAYAVAFLDIVEAEYRADKEIEALTKGLAALQDLKRRLGKAKLVGDGVQGLKQKDIDAILVDLTNKLPELVPGLIATSDKSSNFRSFAVEGTIQDRL